MGSHLATRNQLREMKNSFSQFDTNGDGVISREVFLNAYRKTIQNQDVDAIDERANEIFDQADQDGSGQVDFAEWCTASI